MKFSPPRRWTKAEKWLLTTPILVGLFALAMQLGAGYARREFGLSRQLETDPNTFLLSMAMSRNGKVLVAAGQHSGVAKPTAGTIYCWDAQTLKPLTPLVPIGNEVGVSRTLALSPDGKYVGASRENYRYSLYEVTTGRLMWRREYAEDAQFSPDGQTIALVAGGVQLVNVATGHLIRKLPTKGGYFVAWSPDGKTLACGGPLIHWLDRYQEVRETGLFVELWDVNKNQRIRTLKSELTSSVHFSPDGKSLVAVGDVGKYTNEETWGPRVRVFDVDTGHLKWEKGYKFCDAVFSPDGQTIAALQYPRVDLDEKRNVLFFDPQSGAVQKSLSFRPHCLALYAPSALTFSPDGKRLFVRGDSSVVFWDLN